jgi:hypothetical protein
MNVCECALHDASASVQIYVYILGQYKRCTNARSVLIQSAIYLDGETAKENGVLTVVVNWPPGGEQLNDRVTPTGYVKCRIEAAVAKTVD